MAKRYGPFKSKAEARAFEVSVKGLMGDTSPTKANGVPKFLKNKRTALAVSAFLITATGWTGVVKPNVPMFMNDPAFTAQAMEFVAQPPQKVRVATAWNLVPSQVITPSATKAMSVLSKDVHVIRGGAQSTIQLAIPMWGIHDFITDGNRFSTRNDLAFTAVSIEYNGVVAPIPVNGARSFTAAKGTTVFLPEMTVQSLFGIPSIPNNATIRVNAAFNVAINNEYHKTQPRGNYDGVSRYYTYDPTVTTMNPDAIGASPSYTGTAPTVTNDGLSPIVLGKKIAGTIDKSFVDDGDSRTAGYNESGTGSVTMNGPGYVARACALRDMPRLTTAVGGTRVFTAHNDAVINQLFTYGRYGIIDKATNNLSDGSQTTAATLITRNQDQATKMRAAGVEKLIICGVFPRTASPTNQWATKADQTPNWDLPAQAVAYNAALTGLVWVDGYSNHPSIRDATDATLWKTNGTTSKWETDDGIHGTVRGHTDAGGDLSTVFSSVFGVALAA